MRSFLLAAIRYWHLRHVDRSCKVGTKAGMGLVEGQIVVQGRLGILQKTARKNGQIFYLWCLGICMHSDL